MTREERRRRQRRTLQLLTGLCFLALAVLVLLVDYGDGTICYYRADDTGSGVAGGHIDLCVGSHREALQLGLRTATVYWIEEE